MLGGPHTEKVMMRRTAGLQMLSSTLVCSSPNGPNPQQAALYLYLFSVSQNVFICHSPPPTSPAGSSSSMLLWVQLIPPYIHHGDHRFGIPMWEQHMDCCDGDIRPPLMFLLRPSGCLPSAACVNLLHSLILSHSLSFIFFMLKMLFVASRTPEFSSSFKSLDLKLRRDFEETSVVSGSDDWSLSGLENRCKNNIRSSERLTYIIGLSADVCVPQLITAPPPPHLEGFFGEESCCYCQKSSSNELG